MRVTFVSILLALLLVVPTGDAESASRIRLPEVVELSQTILRGEILEIERLSDSEAEGVSKVVEQRFKVRVTGFLRGKHHIEPQVSPDNTLWLSRKIASSPRVAQRLRRSFAAPFKANQGTEGLFFLQDTSPRHDAVKERTLVRFDWVADAQKLRKFGSVLRKVMKAEGLRIRAESKCRYATYEVKGKCLSASDAFRAFRCPKGSTMHDSKYRDFGLQLACKTIRGAVYEGPTYRWTEYGQLESRTMMSGGKRHGLATLYGVNGVKQSADEYADGQKNGQVLTWHPNGQLQTEGRVVNGLFDGVFKQYSSTGKLLGTYVMNDGTGTLKRWREDGSLHYEAAYNAGKSDGLRRQFYASGQTMSEGTMAGGKMDGLWLFYGANGNVETSVCYEAAPTAHSRQLWRRKKAAAITCPPGPNTAKAE